MTTSQTGYTSNQTYNVTNYTGYWQVLYNHTTYGRIEIISSDVVVSSLSLIGQDGYNNLVSTLNTMSEYYINPTYAIDARSVGSNPTNKAGTSTYFTSSYSYIATYAPTMITSDTTYTTDVTAMETAGVSSASRNYWLTSRTISASTEASVFACRSFTPGLGPYTVHQIWIVNSSGSEFVQLGDASVRPIITLKPDLQIVDSGETINEKTVWNLVAS